MRVGENMAVVDWDSRPSRTCWLGGCEPADTCIGDRAKEDNGRRVESPTLRIRALLLGGKTWEYLG